MLEQLEKKHLLIEGDLDEAVQWHMGDNMSHSYYLDTVTNIRSTRKCCIDACMMIFILCFIMSGLGQLREKNYTGNYHDKWMIEDWEGFKQ